MDPEPDPKTEELRVEQIVREREERTAEHEAVQPDAADQHARRADKAAYLKAKLDERAEAERDSPD